jgi:hypothetical protein
MQYLRVAHVLRSSNVREGAVVVLAGNEAAEVGAIRSLLRWRARDVWFVDGNPVGLLCAKQRWPGVNTYEGDLLLAMDEIPGPLAFINVDLTGHPNGYLARVLKRVSGRLVSGGVLSLTFLAAREHSGEAELQRIAARYGTRSLADLRAAYRHWLTEALGRRADMVFSAKYRSPSAMSVITFQIEPREQVHGEHLDFPSSAVKWTSEVLKSALYDTRLGLREIEGVFNNAG